MKNCSVELYNRGQKKPRENLKLTKLNKSTKCCIEHVVNQKLSDTKPANVEQNMPACDTHLIV